MEAPPLPVVVAAPPPPVAPAPPLVVASPPAPPPPFSDVVALLPPEPGPVEVFGSPPQPPRSEQPTRVMEARTEGVCMLSGNQNTRTLPSPHNSRGLRTKVPILLLRSPYRGARAL